MNEWTGALIALVGVTLGGIMTHISMAKLAKKQRLWDITKQKHAKLEEISSVLDQLEDSYRKVSGAAILKIHNNTPMEFSGIRIPTSKLNTLISFYAPEMLEGKKQLDKVVAAYGEVLQEVITSENLPLAEKKKLTSRALIGHRKISKKCQLLSEMAATIVGTAIDAESNDN